jgi:hypothetical protein
MRFLREAFAAVRRHCGADFPVGLRISLDERDPAGLPEDIAEAAAVALASEGLADYLNVTTGTSATLAGSDHIAPDMTNASGYLAPAAARLRGRVEVPVLVAGRINQPQDAELMKAAAVAAERGHSVLLAEASGRVGGQVLLAERLPGRQEFGGAVTNLYREVARAGVDVRLRFTVDLSAIESERPDLTVLATGARPYRPPLEFNGVDEDTVYLQHVLTDEPVLVEDLAGLVLICGSEPAGELLTEVAAQGLPHVAIGDCLSPRTVEEAVLEGLVAATGI